MIREIGRHLGGGPTVVFIGATHGNEPAGVLALQRVFACGLDGVRARVHGVVGNLRALVRGRRYVDHDLNRGWSEAVANDLRSRPREALGAEDHERLDLLDFFDGLPTPTTFVDLHTTSGHAAPFSVVPDQHGNRALAREMGIPALLGLAESLEGNLVSFLGDRGHVGIGIEGGEHHDPASVDHHESVVWMTLAALGCIQDDPATHRSRLRSATLGHPAAARVVFRHGVDDDDCFVMEPGLSNFQPIDAGQVVARDRAGLIRAPMDGLMMLPKYQGQGDDGFFIARHAAL